jgi:TM2 domain-containing membrane protein YozV
LDFPKSILVLLSMLCCFYSQAQQSDFIKEKGFVTYLFASQNYTDALVLLNTYDAAKLVSAQLDFYYYSKGFAYDKLLRFDSASFFLSKVLPGSNFYEKSIGLGAYNLACNKQCSAAISLLDRKNLDTSMYSKLFKIQKAGYYLLAHNLPSFEKCDLLNLPENPDITLSTQLQHHADALTKVKNKSMLTAGLLSALVPGLGKIYAGKTRQGLVSFLPIALMGLQAFEGYSKKGFHSAGLYVFGSLFTVFYIGNIWGSALAVKINKEERYNEINAQLLLDLRIPMDRLFGTF